jgi:hypothetical protein
MTVGLRPADLANSAWLRSPIRLRSFSENFIPSTYSIEFKNKLARSGFPVDRLVREY